MIRILKSLNKRLLVPETEPDKNRENPGEEQGSVAGHTTRDERTRGHGGPEKKRRTPSLGRLSNKMPEGFQG